MAPMYQVIGRKTEVHKNEISCDRSTLHSTIVLAPYTFAHGTSHLGVTAIVFIVAAGFLKIAMDSRVETASGVQADFIRFECDAFLVVEHLNECRLAQPRRCQLRRP